MFHGYFSGTVESYDCPSADKATLKHMWAKLHESNPFRTVIMNIEIQIAKRKTHRIANSIDMVYAPKTRL